MSDLTDFFPSTGGSSDITDPKLLPRLQVGVSSLVLKGYFGGYVDDTNSNMTSGFWGPFFAANFSEAFSALELSTTFNTYETILDVSSSTNGGYLNHVIGSSISNAMTETYRITVDGVATEFVRTATAASRGVLGWVAPSLPQTSSTNRPAGTGSMGDQSLYATIFGQNQAATPSNGDINDGFIYSSNSKFSLPNAPWAYPALKFKETLKVEIKRSGRYNANAVYNYAGVRHTMI